MDSTTLVHIHKTPEGHLLTTYTEHTTLDEATRDAEERRQAPNTHLTITPTYGNRTKLCSPSAWSAREK